MNERIQKLYKEATGKDWVYDFDPEIAEYFAELILRECLVQGTILTKHYIDTHPEQEQAWLLASIADYSNVIKKHFGVE